MNKQILLGLALMFVANLSNATILRCCKDAGVTGPYIFTTVQAAHDAANAGDTIHIEPSVYTYGNLSMTKPLYIVSVGDFLVQNPNIQATTFPSGRVDGINCFVGSEGSVLSVTVINGIQIDVSSILITNTHCSHINYNTSSQNIASGIIRKSYIDNGIYFYTTGNYLIGNIVCENNRIGRVIMDAGSSATYSKNVFHPNYTINFHNSVVDHNIFVDPSWSISFNNCPNNSDNITNYTALPLGNNNQNQIDFSTVFQNFGAFNGDNYQQLTTSAHLDKGMYAGSDPYRQACQPGIPSIYQLSKQYNSNNLQIEVSTKSNN